LTLASGQALRGNGTLNGSIVVAPGSTVAPGVSPAALTVSGTVTLLGTTSLALDPANATNSMIRGAVGINYGGTLNLSFEPGSLAPGAAFKLFSAGSYSGAFSSIVPATPGAGLAWDTTRLAVAGILKVAPPKFTGITVSGTILVLSGTGGSPGSPYYVLASTNLTLPFTNWSLVTSNVFDANGNFLVTNSISPATPQQFYVLQLP
jgi:hypothetical protein